MGTTKPPHKPVTAKLSPDGDDDTLLTLNKFIAHSGLCSRRAAVDFIKQGGIKVNGSICTNPAHRVHPRRDIILYKNVPLRIHEKKIYVLLNKPKDCLCTCSDEKNRRTVLDLIRPQVSQKVYPVGRLDRATTGLLLLTNDGDLCERLAHPKYNIKKIYQVSTTTPVTKSDLARLVDGSLILEDGTAQADEVAYLDDTKRRLGIEIHSGKHHIIRRMFAALGYTVDRLDRVMFGPLTKKNLKRGRFRLLAEKEIRLLKHFQSLQPHKKKQQTRTPR